MLGAFYVQLGYLDKEDEKKLSDLRMRMFFEGKSKSAWLNDYDQPLNKKINSNFNLWFQRISLFYNICQCLSPDISLNNIKT